MTNEKKKAEARKALAEMYEVLGDSSRFCEHMNKIRPFLRESNPSAPVNNDALEALERVTTDARHGISGDDHEIMNADNYYKEMERHCTDIQLIKDNITGKTNIVKHHPLSKVDINRTLDMIKNHHDQISMDKFHSYVEEIRSQLTNPAQEVDIEALKKNSSVEGNYLLSSSYVNAWNDYLHKQGHLKAKGGS